MYLETLCVYAAIWRHSFLLPLVRIRKLGILEMFCLYDGMIGDGYAMLCGKYWNIAQSYHLQTMPQAYYSSKGSLKNHLNFWSERERANFFEKKTMIQMP